MHKNHLKKLFKLEGYVLDRVEDRETGIFLHCHVRRNTMTHKGERSGRVNETRLRTLPHLMLEDKKVTLLVTQRRFYFSKRKTIRWESLPDVGRGKQTTNTFRLNTLRELQRDNYSGTGFKRQRSHMFPMHILDSLSVEQKWTNTIERIGIDGKGVGKNKLVHNLTNLNQAELKKN
jgi:transposase